MDGMTDIAEAHATALVLRATAKAVRGERGPLMFRLNRAADILDGMAALAVRCLERIKQLEEELRQFRAGGK
ncbi:hypothetical protein GCM10011487_70230 [Steroidobacter agaridevorans]|uniref:Uncharacterized protein n=1 Tax=Steroidobacter agaridevorans TaxID=2695856 RepID=A0A829YQH7_9GAMM|nr:hypothetical protein [Steroidobacter agaridevorans]GFE85023.1 hypothetical protein GCM10011487_70230 [Steroidobacter agaridevorans]GFE86897.1 hypothetical protein GCM10011488_18510 [Steroidobacter agaridevorans]